MYLLFDLIVLDVSGKLNGKALEVSMGLILAYVVVCVRVRVCVRDHLVNFVALRLPAVRAAASVPTAQ